MNSHKLKSLKPWVMALLVLFSASVSAQQAYQLTELPMVGVNSYNSFGSTLNNAGYIHATEFDSNWQSKQTVIWDGSGGFELVPSTFNILYDINNSGVAVGSSAIGGGAISHEDGVTTPIPGQAVSLAVNDARQILGGGGWVPGISSASLYDAGALFDIEQDVLAAVGYEPATDVSYFRESVYGHGLNSAGVVVGRYRRNIGSGVPVVYSSTTIAYTWDDGVVTFLNGLGGNNTAATDINDAGQIVGYASTSSGDAMVTIWTNGVPQNTGVGAIHGFGTIGSDYRINNSGMIMSRSFIYKDGIYTSDEDLLTVAQKAAPYSSLELNDMNDSGQILGTILYMDWSQGVLFYRAVLLTPAPACL